MTQRATVFICMVHLLALAVPVTAQMVSGREACGGSRTPRVAVSFSGQVQGEFSAQSALGVRFSTSRSVSADRVCEVHATLSEGDEGKDFIQVLGLLPCPLRPGTYPIRPWHVEQAGTVRVTSRPSCDRVFNRCAPSNGFYRGDAADAGQFVLTSVTRDWVEGWFVASHRTAQMATFDFDTRVDFSTALVQFPSNSRLPADHPCLAFPCPTELELPLGIPESAGQRDPVLAMAPDTFAGDASAQSALFAMTQAVRARQETFGRRLLEAAEDGGVVRSILKRDNQEAFVDGVVEKAHRNGYATIGEMDDMVRGRFDLCSADDVHKLAEILLYTLPSPDLNDSPAPSGGEPYVRPSKTELPRRPVEDADCACDTHKRGYPRFHVIVQDPATGITHEWQIGTAAVSDVYELPGVNFPPEMWLDLETGAIAPDVHDVDYDIFRQGVRGHDREHGQNMYEQLGLDAFGQLVDQLSAEAHCHGYGLEDLDERIAELHRLAGERLQAVVDHYGIEQVRSWYH